jgi:organic radical activating enzyme
MIDGKWPGHGCEYCKKIEDVGGISDRITQNKKDTVIYLVPPELVKDKTAIKVSPTIVEVYFSNLCNMACLYCSSTHSSVWENEEIKFNLISQEKLDKHIQQKKDYPNLVEKFWKWLEKNSSTIIEYNMLGGEPFFQPELDQNIEFFEKNPCPDLIFTVFSNFKISNSKFRKTLDKINNLVNKKYIREFKVFASIDAWGPQEEYVRYGLDLVQWEENFKTMVEDYPNIRLVIHSTMCNLTIKTYSELIEKVEEYNKIRSRNNFPLVDLSLSFADAATYLRADIFPNGFFDDDFNRMIEVAPTKSLKQKLLGFRDTINNQPYDPNLVKELKIELDDVDRRRNLNWKPLFPWLDEFVIE